MSWPPLYSRDRKGALIVWRVFAEDDMLIFEHGKADGKKIEISNATHEGVSFFHIYNVAKGPIINKTNSLPA